MYPLPVTVIIVTYNSSAVIESCLASVQNVARIIVVDNNSQDDTGAIIRQHYPQVEYIQNSENGGFGRANNLALEQVATPFALLLNPDAVMQEGALGRLIEAASLYPSAAILAPKLQDSKGEVQQSYKLAVFDRDKPTRTPPPPLAENDVSSWFLSGAVMLLRMDYLRQTGFFDPAIFLYYEDDDLCLRARKAGYDLVWVEAATAVHLCGKSSPVTPQGIMWKNWHLTWSRIYLERKYHGNKAAALLTSKLALVYGLKTLCYGLMLNQEKALRSYARMTAALQFWYKK